MGPGVYLLPSAPHISADYELLYAPAVDRIITLSRGQAALLRSASDQRTLNRLLLDGLGVKLAPYVVPEFDSFSYQPTSATLLLTTACQLRCTYCYARGGERRIEHLDDAVAAAGIRIAAKNAHDSGRGRLLVYFHGAGEPTLRLATIKSSIEVAKLACEEFKLKLVTGMTTNLCVSPSVAQWVANNIDDTYVSCDGTPDTMRELRPMPHGDSGQVMHAALAAIGDRGLQDKVCIRATVTGETQNRLIELLDYLVSLGFRRLFLGTVAGVGRGAQVEGVRVPAYLRSWFQALDYAEGLGLRIENPITNLDNLRPFGFICGVSGGGFAVLPDSRVSLCWEAGAPLSERYIVGKLSGTPPVLLVDEDKVRSLRREVHVSNRAVCSSCFCRLSCAGRCPSRDFSHSGHPRDLGMTGRCDIVRTTTLDAIGRRIGGKDETELKEGSGVGTA